MATTKDEAVMRVRARIREKREEYSDFLRHLSVRTREEDLHGAWDAAVNGAEVSNYIDGLEYALAALEGRL